MKSIGPKTQHKEKTIKLEIDDNEVEGEAEEQVEEDAQEATIN